MNIPEKILDHDIVKEMKTSFINYSMSVIMARALPDLRDGLKPVHRRILYTMHVANLVPSGAYKKSATTVGEVLGSYHPHGDTSVYDAMVRMAQSFSYRYPLVDGHGNFGSIYGHEAAAYRYTEARLAKISLEMLRDINKDTVNFTPTYDNSKEEPITLPSRYPNILVSGTMGIAVGMATNIPPHNLGEVIDGCIAYIDNNDITLSELMEHIKGPDFPTYGTILGVSGINKAYETGKGSITIRAKAEIEEDGNKQKIVITEIPYQVNLTSLLEKFSDIIKNKTIDGIAAITDETSQKNGLKIVIELKKDANANVILNNLYKHTQLQSNFSINLLMLVNGVPKTLGLKEIISEYVNYQKEVIIRRTKFELARAKDRAHILEGLKIALDNIDAVIQIIKESRTDTEAKEKLGKNYGLSEAQIEAILEMKLRRLTGLEKEKIEEELAKLMELIDKLNSILASEEKIMNIIKEEMTEIKDKYADERRTKIDLTTSDFLEDESLIPVENIMITLTNKGYIKRSTSETYRTQNRGGVGVKGMTTNEEDFVEHLINLLTHDYIMFFTNKGKVYRLKGYEIPEYSRQAKGIPIVNLLQIEKDEVINSIIKVNKDEEVKNLIFVTKKGLTKRTNLAEFDRIRTTGKICITLKGNDELIGVRKTDGEKSVLLGSSAGRMVKFNENEVRVMGRTASGVKGINLGEHECIGVEITSDDQTVLIVTEKGYGKKTKVSEFRQTKRGSKGVKALNVTEKNGNLTTFKIVTDEDDTMIITNSGMIIRMAVANISTLGRVTQGVRLINLKGNQKVATVSVIRKAEETEDEEVITDEDLPTVESTE